MTSLLKQMRLLFSGRNGSALMTATSPHGKPSPRCRHRLRDPWLEECAREFIRPIAPELCARIRVGWNTRLRSTAGMAIAAHWSVWLNPALKDISREEVVRTLLHELAHLVVSYRHPRRRLAPHGSEWQMACAELGIAHEPSTHQFPFETRRMKRRYLLRCPACGRSHQRVRAPKSRVACLACCRRHFGGLYHEQYRLELVKIA